MTNIRITLYGHTGPIFRWEKNALSAPFQKRFIRKNILLLPLWLASAMIFLMSWFFPVPNFWQRTLCFITDIIPSDLVGLSITAHPNLHLVLGFVVLWFNGRGLYTNHLLGGRKSVSLQNYDFYLLCIDFWVLACMFIRSVVYLSLLDFVYARVALVPRIPLQELLRNSKSSVV